MAKKKKPIFIANVVEKSPMEELLDAIAEVEKKHNKDYDCFGECCASREEVQTLIEMYIAEHYDSSEIIDWSKTERAEFPNLKPSIE